ncbi:MAG TPA: hypothetical protein VIL49_07010, partial [Capillimicrobium sp.]
MGARRAAVAAAVAAGAAIPALAPAQTADQRPRIAVMPRVLTFGETATVDARLIGGAVHAGVAVALLERRLPG